MTKNSMNDCTGLGLIGWIIALPVVLIALLLLAIGFFEATKAYWDYKVRQMCEKDGGIEVYETVSLTKEEYKRLGGSERGLPVPNPVYSNVDEEFPFIREERSTTIRSNSPKVGRSESIIKRRSDDKILGRSVYYWRRGGDFPFGLAEGSSFGCPRPNPMLGQQVIRVVGAPN